MKYFFLIVTFFTISVNAQKITFKDQNLKIALKELGYDFNKNGEIEVSEIDTVKTLKVTKRGIKTIEDLKHFKSIKTLNVMTNEITHLKVFYGNSTIEELYVGENKLGEKLLIKDMPNLKGLYAFRNDLKKIEFVGNFDNFKSLYIQGNPVENLNLQNLPNLENLQLFECDDLKSIDFFIGTKLKQFFLLDTKVVNVLKKENTTTIYLQKNSDPKNSPKIDSIKTAPVIKITKDMIIKAN
jgi:Leucine-rich repeat (LRR) protein